MEQNLIFQARFFQLFCSPSIAIGHQAGNDVSGETWFTVTVPIIGMQFWIIQANPWPRPTTTRKTKRTCSTISVNTVTSSVRHPQRGMMVEPHANEQDQEDALHQITEHKNELGTSPVTNEINNFTFGRQATMRWLFFSGNIPAESFGLRRSQVF